MQPLSTRLIKPNFCNIDDDDHSNDTGTDNDNENNNNNNNSNNNNMRAFFFFVLCSRQEPFAVKVSIFYKGQQGDPFKQGKLPHSSSVLLSLSAYPWHAAKSHTTIPDSIG